jgi:DNA-nicking Smr family endonuclease
MLERMARKPKRKRKDKRDAQESSPPAPKAHGIATSFGPLLARAGLDRVVAAGAAAKAAVARPETPGRGRTAAHAAKAAEQAARAPADSEVAPDPELSQRELALLHRAYQGVQRIDRPRRDLVERPRRRAAGASASAPAGEDEAARQRLSELVGRGVRFDVRWEDGFVQGVREGTSPALLARLRGSGFAAEAELDLHGLRVAEVERAVSEFVRAQHRRGRRYVLIITGKGTRSEGGVGVLGEALAQALSAGGAAPFVLAFATAHGRHGGTGAVAVLFK